MSGRIRSIKPELIEDAVTAGLSDRAFRLFIGAILLADDYGNLRYEPAWLQGQVFWSRVVTAGEFAAAMGELSSLITPYVVNGQKYGAIRNWGKHQKVNHPGKPRVPAESESPLRVSRDSQEDLQSVSCLISDHRSPITDQRPGGEPVSDVSAKPETLIHTQAPPPRPFTMGTPGIEALEVYKAAVSETTGKPFSLIGHGHQVHLCEVLNELAPPGLDRRETLSWMAGRVREWVAEVDPTYTNGFAPAKLAVWLNNQTSPRASGVRMKTVARTGPQGPILKDLVGKP